MSGFTATVDELALADRILKVANKPGGPYSPSSTTQPSEPNSPIDSYTLSRDSRTVTLSWEPSSAAELSRDTHTDTTSNTLSGDTAVAVFSRAEGLSPPVLFRIWELVDEAGRAQPVESRLSFVDDNGSGRLTRTGVAAAMRLLGWAQAPVEVGRETLAQPGPLPRIAIPELTPKLEELPPFSAQKRSKYLHMFRNAGAADGILDADKAQELLNRSKLSIARLSQIWALADVQRRGFLDAADFAIAMYLTQTTVSGKLEVLPAALPEEIYIFAREGIKVEAAKAKALPRSPTDGDAVGPSSSRTSPRLPSMSPRVPSVSPTTAPSSPRVPMPVPQLVIPPSSSAGDLLSPNSASAYSPGDFPFPAVASGSAAPFVPVASLSPTADNSGLTVPEEPRRRASSSASSGTSENLSPGRIARTMPSRRGKLRSKSVYIPSGEPSDDTAPRKPRREPLMHMASMPPDLMQSSRELMQRPRELMQSSRELYQSSRDMLKPGQLRKRLEDVEAERRLLELVVDGLRADVARLRGAVDDLGIHKTIIADLTGENERLRARLRGDPDTGSVTASSVPELRARIAEQEETLRAFQAADAADADIAQVQVALTKENDTLRHSRDERVERLQEELAGLRSERDADRRLVQGMAEEVESVRRERARAREEAEALRERMEAAEREAEELKVRLREVQEENERLAAAGRSAGPEEGESVPPPAYTEVAAEEL